jgi:hypothetical protein
MKVKVLEMRYVLLAKYALLVFLPLFGLTSTLAQDLADVLDRVRPAIVTIEATAREGSSLGTGFVVRRDGVVLTAAHVIKDANRIRVRFPDGKAVGVERIIAEDTDQDFALLKLNGSNYPVLPLGNSGGLRQGQRILALGNPLGLDFTASEGIISALRDGQLQSVRPGSEMVYVQISAAISQGNSGGPVMNLAGEAVGVAIFKFKGGENLNFALAIDRIKPILNRPVPTLPSGTGESWFVVASRAKNLGQEYRFVSGNNPLADDKWLQSKWNGGFKITDIAEGKDRWVIMLSKSTAYGLQTVFTDRDFPANKVKESWREGYYITSALYGGDRWLVVMSKNKAFTDQTYHVSAEFPQDWIKVKFNEGFRLSVVNGDGQRWVVVMTKGTGFTGQVYRTFDETPRDWIRDKWREGYFITHIGNSSGKWVVVMSQGAIFQDQSWWFGDSFPDSWVKEQWNKGWDVTGVR